MSASPPPTLSCLRSSIGRGRPYPPEVLAAVRGLVEGTGLLFREIAGQTGINAVVIARWSRRYGWRRPGRAVGGATLAAEGVAQPLIPPLQGRATRAKRERGEDVRPGVPLRQSLRDCHLPLQGEDRPAAHRRPGRYGPAEHEAARALIEGTELSLEQIELRLGISSLTLFRWCRQFGWSRPERPGAAAPRFARYRRRGRPYAADAVGVARRLATTTHLPQTRIAAQAGVCQQTVSAWIRERGWTRPPVRRGQPGYQAACRAAALAAAGRPRGRGYGPDVVAETRRLYVTTELPTAFIAAQLGVSANAVTRWARQGGWTRPRHIPEPDGRPARRQSRHGP